MSLFIVTPTNYGLIPYGQASYVSYLANTVPSTPATAIPIVEILGNSILPAFIKAYWVFPS